ncbi:MAG: glucose-1-phosphate adenylyltransferase subunit GlgD [Clostridiales bacterium]|nr:glucose-1-phosphate adenylyltransferase subunit GlgD [Clostridiales bacterium]
MNAVGIIYAIDEGIELGDITRERAVASVPVGGRYRMIDFVLSNMVNSGIQSVGIIIQNHYNSLLVHLGSGKEWDLDRKRGGLFMFPPYASNGRNGWHNGSTDALQSIRRLLKKTKNKYVIISGSNVICNMLYNDAMNFHISKGADVTAIYKEDKKFTADELRKNIIIQTDEDGRVRDAKIEPAFSESFKVLLNMYIIEKSLLEYLVDECLSKGSGDFIKDMLLNKLDSLKIYGYGFKGYSAIINSIIAYYRHNMDLLDPSIRNEVFFKSGIIYTRVMDEVPAKYSSNARVRNCLVADGCVIDGEVLNSVLFRGVKVSRGAKIENSIIMSYSEVMEDCILQNVILDKEVIIRKGRKLIGQKNYPVVIRKESVV